MTNTLKTRIERVMLEGESDAEFSRRIGLSRSAVSLLLDGTTKTLKPENAYHIQDITGFSARWLQTGKGPERVGDATFDLNNVLTALEATIIVRVQESFAEARGSPQHGGKRKAGMLIEPAEQARGGGRRNPAKAGSQKQKSNKGAAGTSS
jgi:hypothetical protein